jgi:hypothetical protein
MLNEFLARFHGGDPPPSDIISAMILAAFIEHFIFFDNS